MTTPEFPLRFFTKDDEPCPTKSIGYYSGDAKLFNALAESLEEDEWAELMNSRLGVFLKFHALDFAWASRLVHHILSFQLECKKPYEIWSLIGVNPLRFSLYEFEYLTGLNCEYVANLETPEVEVTDEMKEFWELLGVGIEMGPSTDELTAACSLCKSWTREERMRLGYLAIYASYIEARKGKTPTRVNLARLVMDLEAFEEYPWGRVAFKNLIESIKDKDLTKTYLIEGFVQVLQVWVYFALPDYASEFGEPFPNNPTPLLLAFKGSRGRKNVKTNMLKHARVNNFVLKDIVDEMFPFWDDDEEDVKIVNILKVKYGAGGWKWTKSHWSTKGIKLSNNVKIKIGNVKSENLSLHSDGESRKRSRASTSWSGDEDPVSLVQRLQSHFDVCFIELSTKIKDGFSSCEQKIKALSDKVVAVEQSIRSPRAPAEDKDDDDDEDNTLPDVPNVGSKFVNIETNSHEAQSESVNRAEPSVMIVDNSKPPTDYVSAQKLKQNERKKAVLLLARAKSERLRKLAPSQVSPFIGNRTAKVVIPKGQGYDPFAPVDTQKVKVLDDLLKLDPDYPKLVKHSSPEWFWCLRTPTEWLKDTHMDAGINLLRLRFSKHPEWFRSEKICFVDTLLGTMWTAKYKDFDDFPANEDGSGKLLPAGAFDYYTGAEPSYCRTNKIWGIEVDDIYFPLHISGDHWVALWISIPKRHIVVWDSIVSHASDVVISKAVKPIAVMFPYLLHEACEAKERHKYPYDPFTHERIKRVPQNVQSGDCGVYCLKYIECHALGIPFTSILCDANIFAIREKLAAEIFDETNIRGTESRTFNLLDLYD